MGVGLTKRPDLVRDTIFQIMIFMKCPLCLAIYLLLIAPVNADSFDQIGAKKEFYKWVQGGGSYLMRVKGWKS